MPAAVIDLEQRVYPRSKMFPLTAQYNKFHVDRVQEVVKIYLGCGSGIMRDVFGVVCVCLDFAPGDRRSGSFRLGFGGGGFETMNNVRICVARLMERKRYPRPVTLPISDMIICD